MYFLRLAASYLRYMIGRLYVNITTPKNMLGIFIHVYTPTLG
jgi:hypothetical protein